MVLQPDIPDMTLWQARLSKALGITDPQVIGNVLSQLGSCAPDGNVEQMLNLALELLDLIEQSQGEMPSRAAIFFKHIKQASDPY